MTPVPAAAERNIRNAVESRSVFAGCIGMAGTVKGLTPKQYERTEDNMK